MHPQQHAIDFHKNHYSVFSEKIVLVFLVISVGDSFMGRVTPQQTSLSHVLTYSHYSLFLKLQLEFFVVTNISPSSEIRL